MNDDEVVYELATPPQGAPPKHFSCTQASRRPSPSLSSPARPSCFESMPCIPRPPSPPLRPHVLQPRPRPIPSNITSARLSPRPA